MVFIVEENGSLGFALNEAVFPSVEKELINLPSFDRVTFEDNPFPFASEKKKGLFFCESRLAASASTIIIANTIIEIVIIFLTGKGVTSPRPRGALGLDCPN